MKIKYMKLMAAGLATIMMLSGCGNKIPDMTEAQAQQIGEYAALTLLKYDANNRSRLVDKSVIEAYDAKQKELQELASHATPKPQGMKPVDDTPVIEIGEDATDVTTVISVEDFYGLSEGVTITYQGQTVCDSYAGDASEAGFALEASSGKKLLVLNFQIANQSGSEQNIDLFAKTATYRVLLNGSETVNVLTTMLMDDMSTYMDTIPAGETRDVVLIAEIKENMAETISSISLNLKNESKTGTIQLR